MSEAVETATRLETVTENIAAIEEKYGKQEAKQTMIWQCVKDISISLAMLVDAGASSSTTSEET